MALTSITQMFCETMSLANNVPDLSHGTVFLWKLLLCLHGEQCLKLAHRTQISYLTGMYNV